MPAAHAVLDPFAVYAEGEHVLHGELEALSEGQLRTIIRDHGLENGAAAELLAADAHGLAHHSLHVVRNRASR